MKEFEIAKQKKRKEGRKEERKKKRKKTAISLFGIRYSIAA